MAQRIIRFINTLTAALLVGIVFGVWAGFNPFDLSAVAYIEQQQNLIRQLNVPKPAFGFITILITLVAAFLHRNNKQIMALHIIAVFLIITGLITRFGNQVINAQVITWNSMDPPGNWKTVRDQWWIFHCYRTVMALAALGILLWIKCNGYRYCRREQTFTLGDGHKNYPDSVDSTFRTTSCTETRTLSDLAVRYCQLQP